MLVTLTSSTSGKLLLSTSPRPALTLVTLTLLTTGAVLLLFSFSNKAPRKLLLFYRIILLNIVLLLLLFLLLEYYSLFQNICLLFVIVLYRKVLDRSHCIPHFEALVQCAAGNYQLQNTAVKYILFNFLIKLIFKKNLVWIIKIPKRFLMHIFYGPFYSLF